MRVSSLAAVLSLSVACVAQLAAQRVQPAGLLRRASGDSIAPTYPTEVVPRIRNPAALRPWAPLVSAVAPGGGQLILGQNRFVAYAAVELYSWWQYHKNTQESSKQEAAFKELARRVARSHFSTNLPDADWTYYESMKDFKESGAYSLASSGPVVPETDASTFNGFKWEVALATHANDRAAALAQYEAAAIKPDFRWSWRNADLQWDLFVRTTDSRKDAYHAAVTDLMIIGANHVLSLIDAFATFRLQVQPQAGGRTGLGASVTW